MECLPDNGELATTQDSFEKVIADDCVWLETGGKMNLHPYVKKFCEGEVGFEKE
jgi:hypothetical protein